MYAKQYFIGDVVHLSCKLLGQLSYQLINPALYSHYQRW